MKNVDKQINKLKKIINKCQILHNQQNNGINSYELTKTVPQGYQLALDLIKDAAKNKNKDMFGTIYCISRGLMPSDSKQDGDVLDLLSKYKNDFCKKVVELVHDDMDFIVKPCVKSMKLKLAQNVSDMSRADLTDRLNTIYTRFPIHFLKELKQICANNK